MIAPKNTLKKKPKRDLRMSQSTQSSSLKMEEDIQVKSPRRTDPDLNRNATNYRDNHKHKDSTEIILHFINVKY